MNFKQLFALAALSFLFFYQFAFIKPYSTQKIFSSPRISQYHAKYNKIHANALNRIKNELKITNKDWDFYMNSFADIVKQDTLFASYPLDRSSISSKDHWLVKEAKEILIQCGIDPKNIQITLDYDPQIRALAEQKLIVEKDIIKHKLIINPDWLGKLLPQERESVIRHEIMHLVFYDTLEEGYIVGLLQEMGRTQETINNHPAILNNRRQREMRADIFSVIDKPILAKVSQERYEKKAQVTKSLPASHWKTHPSDEKRAQNFAQLLADINQPQFA